MNTNMKFYLDTEFIERGYLYPIELISIGLVAETGDSFYAICSDGWHEEHASPWVIEHVLPNLGDGPRLSREDIARIIKDFVFKRTQKPKFWSYYGAYDWVVFCQLFGRMIDLPKGFPFFCRDVIQLCKEMGNPELPKPTATPHNALNDAQHIRSMHNFLLDLKPESTATLVQERDEAREIARNLYFRSPVGLLNNSTVDRAYDAIRSWPAKTTKP